MKNHKLLWVIEMLTINLFLFLAGCTASSPTPISPGENPADISTVAASRTPLTRTPLPPTPIPAVTSTLTSTPTATPMPIDQPAPIEPPITIPAPPDGELTQQVLWLFETNNGCQLPCWWGITPGQTEWSVAEEFFHRFDKDLYEASSTPGLVSYGISIPLPTDIFVTDYTYPSVLVQNGIVERIQADILVGDTYPDSLNHYMLPMLLTTYGEPAEVGLSTFSSDPGGEGPGWLVPFAVVLFYPDQGIAALYGDIGEISGDMVRGCPQARPVSTLKLWSPDKDFTFEELIKSSSAFNKEYLSLQEATGMDVATFYETFKNPDNTTCLETPANLWR
ncbi:MAG: hypothetical protein KJ069_21550 [Anaerolineae bacterium]|nr:hypothetical protein [Anaerolineae bacterium]